MFLIRKDNNIEKAQELLSKGYDPNYTVNLNDGDYSPLLEAVVLNRPEIARVLLFHGGRPIFDGKRYSLYEAVKKDANWFRGMDSLSKEDAAKWEELIDIDEMLRTKFANTALHHGHEVGAEKRKKTLLGLLKARSAGNRKEALEIAEKFHKENPEHKTALRFTRMDKTA